MVTAIVLCWIVTHTTSGAKDYRDYKQYRGYVERNSGQDYLMVNFYDDFKKHKVNMRFNSPEQRVNENECLYVP